MDDFDSRDLTAFQEWRMGFEPAPDANAYLAQHLSVTAAALFSDLMYPDFVLVRGCVILRSRYNPANFEEWWSKEEGNAVAVEQVLNHLHLWEIFEPDGADEERALEILATRIARSWKQEAELQFPERDFTTEISEDYGPTVVISSRPKARLCPERTN